MVYPGPPGVPYATDRQVWVNGVEVPVYDTEVNFNRVWLTNPDLETTPMAYFDMPAGPVAIRVRAPGLAIRSAVVRPRSLGIEPHIEGDTVSFVLDRPAKLTLELNDSPHRALHLFANAAEEDAPAPGDPGVIYFGPGVHHAGAIEVKSGQTVYIAGGAVVYGWIHADSVHDVRIRGRGIIDGSIYDRWADVVNPISIRNSDNVRIEGIILLNPAAWTLEVFKSRDVEIHDVKIISARPNSDGISIQSSHHVRVTDSFVRSWDDSLVVKGYDGDASDIVFDDIIVWTDLAQSCEIGYETRASSIRSIWFKDITVLHNFHKPVLSIHNSDNAVVSDVHYENVVVEDAQMGMGDGRNYLIDLWIGRSQWTKAESRGHIRDVYIRNVQVTGGRFPSSRIAGYDEQHLVENVYIENLTILGKPVASPADGDFRLNPYVRNLQFYHRGAQAG